MRTDGRKPKVDLLWYVRHPMKIRFLFFTRARQDEAKVGTRHVWGLPSKKFKIVKGAARTKQERVRKTIVKLNCLCIQQFKVEDACSRYTETLLIRAPTPQRAGLMHRALPLCSAGHFLGELCRTGRFLGRLCSTGQLPGGYRLGTTERVLTWKGGGEGKGE